MMKMFAENHCIVYLQRVYDVWILSYKAVIKHTKKHIA